MIRDIDGICKSAIYLKSNTDGVNQFLFNLSTIKNSGIEKKKFQEDNETPKQVDRSEKKFEVVKDNSQKTILDSKANLPKPEFTPEVLSLLLDAAYQGINFTYLSQLENNIAGRNELELFKWDQNIDISIIGNSTFEQRKMIV